MNLNKFHAIFNKYQVIRLQRQLCLSLSEFEPLSNAHMLYDRRIARGRLAFYLGPEVNMNGRVRESFICKMC